MCGICGSTRDPEGRITTAISAGLVHRGPDDHGLYLDPASGASLGARRLSIIDVEGGHQPVTNEDGTIAAVLNGEIYNHPSLRDMLLERGHRLASHTDTVILAHLYEEFGEDMVHAIEGMYAFAVWDTRRQRLLLARDRFGEKPLFVHHSATGHITFGSELTALVHGAGIDAELDARRVDAYFVFGYVPGPGTLITGVDQVRPGHLLIWDRESRQTRHEPYWELPQFAASEAEGFDELVRETRRLLRRAVRSRRISDVPLGVFLSGGVDSSLVAALAAEDSSAPIKTFSVGYEVGNTSELSGAELVAKHLGTDHHETVLTTSEVARRLPWLLSSMDQPVSDQALVALNALSEVARKEVKVIIGGEGADELFGGYPRYAWLERAQRLEHLLPSSAAHAGGRLLSAWAPTRQVELLARVLTPAPLAERQLDWVTSGRRHIRERIYGRRLSGCLDDALLSQLEDRLTGDEVPVASRLMKFDQLQWLPDDVLAKADRASMLASLEVRTPYLTREVAEFAASVPPAMHLRRGGKSLLRSVLSDLLPRPVRARRKVAFRVPASEWLSGPLAGSLSEQIRSGAAFEEGWFDRRAISKVAEDHLSGRSDGCDILWPVYSFGLWLDRLRGGSTTR